MYQRIGLENALGELATVLGVTSTYDLGLFQIR